MRVEEVTGGRLFEEAGLQATTTGLPFYIWISPKAGAKHDVRIKCSPSFKYDPEREVTVGLRSTFHIIHGTMSKEDARQLQEWVSPNYDTVLGFWNEEFSNEDMRGRLRPLFLRG